MHLERRKYDKPQESVWITWFLPLDSWINISTNASTPDMFAFVRGVCEDEHGSWILGFTSNIKVREILQAKLGVI